MPPSFVSELLKPPCLREQVRKELQALQEELRPVLARYEAERHRLSELRRLRQKRDELLVRLGPQHETNGNFNIA